MSRLNILCSEDPQELIALADRLDGHLVEDLVCDRGHNLSFEFTKETFAQQFIKAVVLFPKYLELHK